MDLDDNDEFMDSPDIGSTDGFNGSPASATLQSLNSLPFNRREMDQWNKEFSKAVEYSPKQINLFDEPPSFTLQDPNDSVSIQRMKEYFTTKNARKRQLIESVDKNTEISGEHIKKQLCYIDLGYFQSVELKTEIEKLREEFAVLSSKTQMLNKENNALKTRLSKYEAIDVIDRQRNEDARNRSKKKDAALEKQRQMLQQVENCLDERPGAVATLRKQFDYKENVTKSATLKKPLTSSSNRPARYPPSVTTISTSSSSSNEGPVSLNTRNHGQLGTPHRSRK
uniref:Uncharacterized protein n=1 Tax=Panagrolaimus sp. PS1159 TaxID=55785 RepID=A0AC35F9G4_9BILA